ncbi:MAG: UvrD-helicase domain-containing protein [Patescibacteria group bacterium]
MHGLNPEQTKAVEHIDGPVLIIAGAGSGKTRVITHRILNLIKNGVAPRDILAITFTNKAAKEMRERVFALLADSKELNTPVSANWSAGRNAETPFVSTFHALGVHIIRENAHLLGLTRHFTIYDRADSKRAVKEAMLQSSIDPKKFEPNVILNKISMAKGSGMNHIQYGESAKDFMEEMIAGIWEKYDAILSKEKALDFDDLLLRTCQLLENNLEIRKHYSSIWKYIHIDEYQDTNRVQYRIAKYLAESHRNICVVGDADQNIYSWRGATIENILNFEKDYPETAVIVLEKNYRSTKTILAAANMVIEKNILRKKKVLYTDNEDGEKISIIASYTEMDEARAVADICRNAIAEGISPQEIAVLYRANFQSRALEEAFIKKNVPYQLLGTRFFERKEVKDVLSYIRAALNKESLGDIARIINVPTRGIGKVTVARIFANQENLIPEATREKIAGFWNLLDNIKKEIFEKKPSETLKFVIQESGIEKMFGHSSAGRRGDSDDEERLLNIRELVSVATQYDHMNPEDGTMALLENAALATDQDELEKKENAVKLMTVHASKGLEFEIICIAGMEQDLFPFKHLDEGKVSQSEEEEERRLFYVALTRAKKKVYLSYTIIRTVYGAQRVNAPSEFIDDIEKELIDDTPLEKPTGAKAIFIDF